MVTVLFMLVASPPTGQTVLGKELLETAISFHIKLPEHVEQSLQNLVMRAYDIYSPEEFKEFISTEDSDGWNILMHYAANGEVIRLHWLFDLLKKIYGTNQQDLFDILFEKGNLGRTPLFIAVMRKQTSVVKLLLETAYEFFGTNKDMFFTYTQQPDSLTQWTPLMLAAYLNSYKSMHYILQAETKAFGAGAKRLRRWIKLADSLSDRTGKEIISQYHGQPRDKSRIREFIVDSSVFG